ncbi:MAG: cupin domain-containing protein [Acidimicrobiia bacterium]
MFTGEVWLSPGMSTADGGGTTLVQFSPGARTVWHAHPGWQVLFATSGRGIVCARGEARRELLPGDVAYAAPGEWHYHGATPKSPLTQLSVISGGPPEWGAPVTQTEYVEGEAPSKEDVGR